MADYDGITRDALFLLAENRFRDSRAFYEEHKEALKQGVTVPMRQLAGILGGELLSLDPLMCTIPTKMVSRIRRDTRFTKDQSLYREHMWIMFMRPKHEWENYPAFWFEVSPNGYSMGVGLYGHAPGLMQTFRAHICAREADFRAAVRDALASGAVPYGERYKRPQPGCPTGLEALYNCKDFGFIYESSRLEDLADETIIGILRGCFRQLAPTFRFLLAVSDDYFAKTIF
ncbi:MAG: DUF2461 domain-containing protein [Clostridia bacterium]|nr:DUF2461 domain-containing protein [Clostridia bacterium]